MKTEVVETADESTEYLYSVAPPAKCFGDGTIYEELAYLEVAILIEEDGDDDDIVITIDDDCDMNTPPLPQHFECPTELPDITARDQHALAAALRRKDPVDEKKPKKGKKKGAKKSTPTTLFGDKILPWRILRPTALFPKHWNLPANGPRSGKDFWWRYKFLAALHHLSGSLLENDFGHFCAECKSCGHCFHAGPAQTVRSWQKPYIYIHRRHKSLYQAVARLLGDSIYAASVGQGPPW